MNSLKIVVVGDTKVGKSCILQRFTQGTFDHSNPATIGAAFLTKIITTDHGQVRLQLWDTAGQEKFRSLAPMYYRSANVAILVYDVTSKQSLEDLEDWSAEIADKAPQGIKIVVIGNKIDMDNERVISTQAGQESANKMNAVLFAETSALTGAGVNEIFTKIADFDEEIDPEPVRTPPPKKEEGCSC